MFDTPKVAYLVSGTGPDGAISGPEVMVRDHLLPLLADNGMQGQYVTTGDTIAAREIAERGVPVHTLPFTGIRSWKRTRIAFDEYLSRWKPDLVVCNGPIVLDTLAGRRCRRAGVPYVVLRHILLEESNLSGWKCWLWRPLDRKTLRRAAGVIFVQPHARQHAIDKLGCDPDRAVFIMQPIDINRFAPADVTSAPTRDGGGGADRGGPRIVGVGQLTHHKGWHVFLNVVAQVRRQVPGARAAIVGQGPEEPALRSQMHRLGLDDCVEIIGYTPNVADLLRACDVYCSTSWREGLSLAAAEAMATGLPLVLTDVSGSDALVEHGVNGYIEPCGGVGPIADRLVELHANPNLRDQLAQASRSRALQLFDPGRTRQSYIDLYRKAMAAGNAE